MIGREGCSVAGSTAYDLVIAGDSVIILRGSLVEERVVYSRLTGKELKQPRKVFHLGSYGEMSGQERPDTRR